MVQVRLLNVYFPDKHSIQFVRKQETALLVGAYPDAIPVSGLYEKELAMWVAQGKGEVLDTNNSNRRIHSFDYRPEEEDRPLGEIALNQYKVRLYGDSFWHEPDRRYMDIPRWYFVKFVKYIGSKFPKDTFNLQGSIQNSVFFVNGKGLATMLGVAPCENGTLDDLSYKVRWESVTDKDVIRIVNAVKNHINPE